MSDCWAIGISWPGLRPSTRRDRGCALRLPPMELGPRRHYRWPSCAPSGPRAGMIELRVSPLRWRQTSCCMSPLISAYILQDLHTTVLRRELDGRRHRLSTKSGPAHLRRTATIGRPRLRPVGATEMAFARQIRKTNAAQRARFYTCICEKLSTRRLTPQFFSSAVGQLRIQKTMDRKNPNEAATFGLCLCAQPGIGLCGRLELGDGGARAWT